MVADALAPCVARTSAPMALTYRIGKFLSYMRNSTACAMSLWRNGINCRYIFMLPNNELTLKGLFNSLWPGDAIWRQGSRSTLVQVMACCLTAPTITWTNVDLSSVRSSKTTRPVYLARLNHCSSGHCISSEYPRFSRETVYTYCKNHQKLFDLCFHGYHRPINDPLVMPNASPSSVRNKRFYSMLPVYNFSCKSVWGFNGPDLPTTASMSLI